MQHDDYAISVMPVDRLDVRPDLFQARDTDAPGASTGAERVAEIVRNFNPERLDPVWVVRDPKTDKHVVIGGHHRLEAVRQLGRSKIPVKVLKGDPNDPEDRQRLIRESVASNYTLASPNLRENITAASRLAKTGLDADAVAREMRAKRSQVDDFLWLHRTGPQIIEQVTNHPELAAVAAEIGRAMETYDLSAEDAGALFRKYQQEYVEEGRAPSRNSVRQTFRVLAVKSEQSGQAGMFEGFEGSAKLSAIQQLTGAIEDARRDKASLRRNVNACKVLADTLGLSVEEIEDAADRKLEDADERLERLRGGILRPQDLDAGSDADTAPDEPESAGEPSEPPAEDAPEPSRVKVSDALMADLVEPPAEDAPEPSRVKVSDALIADLVEPPAEDAPEPSRVKVSDALMADLVEPPAEDVPRPSRVKVSDALMADLVKPTAEAAPDALIDDLERFGDAPEPEPSSAPKRPVTVSPNLLASIDPTAKVKAGRAAEDSRLELLRPKRRRKRSTFEADTIKKAVRVGMNATAPRRRPRGRHPFLSRSERRR